MQDLALTPYAISTLDVLQSCPTQRSALPTTIREVDPKKSQVIIFDTTSVKPRLPHHVNFHIKALYRKRTIF